MLLQIEVVSQVIGATFSPSSAILIALQALIRALRIGRDKQTEFNR